METRTRAYIEFEDKLGELDLTYKPLLSKSPEDMTDNDWKSWEEYDKKVELLFKDVKEDSYKELYDLFEKVTGYTLETCNVDWDFFKCTVDENLGNDEEVYNLYFPDMVRKFQEVGEKWFEQTNHN